MKRSIALLLATFLILGALTFTACGGSNGSKTSFDEKILSFTTIGDLKKSGTEYEFITANSKLEDDGVVCQLSADASGAITIPAKYDDKEVIAVISENAENTQATSLNLENGISFIENCFTGSSAVESITLPASVKGIYNSFNASAVSELSFPTGVKYIVNSFNNCEKLNKIETTGYVYGINESFSNDAALADVTFSGSIQKIEGSFLKSGVTSLTFVENIHDIAESFNECPALTSFTVEQIAGGVNKSFNSCPALTDLVYKQGGEKISGSFNDGDVLENVDFGSGVGSISDSFENCPKFTLTEDEAE